MPHPTFPDRGPLTLGDGQEAQGVYAIHTAEWMDLLMSGWASEWMDGEMDIDGWMLGCMDS